MAFRLRVVLAIFVAAAASLLIVALACYSSPTRKLTEAMLEFGLREGTVVHGVVGASPKVLKFGARRDQVYAYHSLSKPITAAAALELADRRVLSLEDEIEGVTVRQLLQHLGGWDRKITGDPTTAMGRTARCVDIVPGVKQFEPGTRQIYSNIGYCLVGRHFEERAGKAYEQTVREVVPETLAMQFDAFHGPASGWGGTALQYWEFAGRPVDPRMVEKPEGVEVPYFGLAWRVTPNEISHFGIRRRQGFTLVVRKDNFVAVAMFEGNVTHPAKTREALQDILLSFVQ